jgi:hypothetical protein
MLKEVTKMGKNGRVAYVVVIMALVGVIVGGYWALKPTPHVPTKLKFLVAGKAQPVVLDVDPNKPLEVYDKLRLAGFSPEQICNNVKWRRAIVQKQVREVARRDRDIARRETQLATAKLARAKSQAWLQANRQKYDFVREAYEAGIKSRPTEVANRP